jgi:hypothetical protein
MSYIWIYDKSDSNMSYIDYNTSKDENTNYNLITQYGSFVEANQYIKQQIDEFITSYKNVSSSSSSKKSMSNRYQDIYNMQLILMKIMQEGLKKYYGNDYNSIRDVLIDYYNYNETINNGLDEINGTKYSMNYSMNTRLDYTIYSTVLWVILAICLVYYVFIKL